MVVLAFAYSLITILAFSICAIKAQSDATIYINADGSILGTDKIMREGNIYTLTDNIQDTIMVLKDNIVIDGSNHSCGGINLASYGRNNITIKYVEGGIGAGHLSNSIIYACKGTVQLDFSFNISLVGNTGGFFIEFCSNISICGNYLADSPSYGIILINSNNTSIFENTITSNNVGLYLSDSLNNTIVRNNFVNNTKQVDGHGAIPNIWSNDNIGNYWSDNTSNSTYTIKLMGEGFMNFTQVLDYDYHAQFQPFTIPIYPIPTSPYPSAPTSPSPIPTPSPTPSSSPTQQPTAPPSTYPPPIVDPYMGWIPYAIIALAVVSIAVLFYFKKRKR
jgi:parallel beta-helix repeat protein